MVQPVSPPRALVPDDLLQLRTVADTQISPDGAHVVYTVSELDKEHDTATSHLWLAPTDGGEPRPLTTQGRNNAPRWSLDSKEIAFLSNRGGGPMQLWLLSLAGGDPTQLTHLHGGAGAPVWSPDGKEITFSARVTPEQAPKHAPRVARRLRTFVNGNGYIGDGFYHLFVTKIPGGETQQITDGPWHHFGPTWSPDGKNLAFSTTRREDWDLEWVWDIYTSDAAGGDLRQLTGSMGVCQSPAWSPDGAQIAYYDNRNTRTGSTEDYRLFTITAHGDEPHDLSGARDRGLIVYEPPASPPPPVWSPDSRSVFALVQDAGRTQIERFALDGTATPVIADAGAVGMPTISADGTRLAYTWTNATAPAEVWTSDRDGNERQQLTRVNETFLQGIARSSPSRITVVAEDGRRVESVVWLPPGKTAADGPFPTVLQLHGGPHGAVGEAFSAREQMLTGHGFAVCAVNFRGSAGYGKAFADSILGKWGALEFADAMRALDHLVSAGIADGDQLGVYGGSYGGFMTNMMVTRTDRFKAAVTMATISDLATLSGTTDQWESIDFDLGGPPWEAGERYREYSPFTRVAAITTPLLILHGEEDHTCAITEAQMLFIALRKLRREVEFVRYPGESHGFMRGRPGTQLDAHARLLAWFRDHLMR